MSRNETESANETESNKLKVDAIDCGNIELALQSYNRAKDMLVNCQKSFEKAEFILSGTLKKLADARGILVDDHSFNLEKASFIPKLKPPVSDTPPVSDIPIES